MAGRYPNTVFHFTDKKGLLGILKNNFRISYAREKIVGSTLKREFGAPMVSFCDLRLSEVSDHMKAYGKYGIGMSKTWANSNGLNPVCYLNTPCRLNDNLIGAIDDFFKHLNNIQSVSQHQAMSTAYMNLMDMYRYIKNYEGELWRNGILKNPNFRFANEREWRYVPSLIGDLFPFVPLSAINTSAKKATANARYASSPLEFGPSDIRYIIVRKDSERDEIIKKIFLANTLKYGSVQAQRMASRILTAEQINDDI